MHCLRNSSKYWRIKYSLPGKWKQGVERCSKMNQGEARCSKLSTKVWRQKTSGAGYELYFPLWVAFFVLSICRTQKVTKGMQSWSCNCKQHACYHLPLFVCPTLAKTVFPFSFQWFCWTWKRHWIDMMQQREEWSLGHSFQWSMSIFKKS